MQTNNILILINKNFASKDKKAVRNAKIKIKDWKYLTSIQSIKFNRVQIKLDSNGIILTKKCYIGGIFPVIDHDADSTNSKEIIRKKLLPKEQYLA